MVTIEPIKNQYLTALKERQQIIDKLNEIITGLNALNFDDLTTIQAELVAIRESLQTQNTAITEINNSIGQIESELTSFENDTALNLQSKVNKNGDTMTGNLGIPTTTTGTKDNLAVNGKRLQNDLDNYSQMVRLTGNQTITGEKTFFNDVKTPIISWQNGNAPAIKNKVLNYDVTETNTVQYYPGWYMYDKNDVRIGGLFFIKEPNTLTRLILRLRNSDGTTKEIELGKGDTI